MTDDHNATPTTALGTPVSPKWDADWLTLVDLREQDLGRRICGAHTPAWTPCTLASSHRNGRCRFHGGAPGIGAPNGNRNAWVHGLYSRRLQQCGDHCPLWKHCPMAGKDVLDMYPAERPHCVYEQDEYDQILADLRNDLDSCDDNDATNDPAPLSFPRRRESPPQPGATIRDEDPCPSDDFQDSVSFGSTFSFSKEKVDASPHEPNLIERNVALFQVMLTRAQAALRITTLTDEFLAEGHRYNARSIRVGALLQAQLHIARELRQWLKLLPGFDPGTRFKANAAPKTQPPQPEEELGLAERMAPILRETEVAFDELLGPGGWPGRPPKPALDPPPAPA